jgi:polyhydroxybutyrate depolymerase
LVSGGQIRQYRRHVPPGYQAGTPIPLVLGFHGQGGDAAGFESYSGLSTLADGAGFIAVYPQGLGEMAGWDTWHGSADVQFVRDLLDGLQASCSIDPRRIYAAGHSRGGGMVNRLGCDLADRLAAIGPVSGAYETTTACSPSRPVPVIAFHGLDDPVVYYNGFRPPGQIHDAYFAIGTPIPQWASAWADRDGCSFPSAAVPAAAPLTGQAWGDCAAGAEVVLYTVDGGGHGWPGGPGEPAGDFSAAQMIWDFFLRHPLGSP